MMVTIAFVLFLLGVVFGLVAAAGFGYIIAHSREWQAAHIDTAVLAEAIIERESERQKLDQLERELKKETDSDRQLERIPGRT